MSVSGAKRGWALLVTAVASLSLVACGSSNHSDTASSRSSSATSGSSSGANVTTGPVRATLKGDNHRPVANKNWVYTVTATDAHGHPLSGTVLTEFAFQGTVVGRETPPTHPLKDGHLRDELEFPARSVGYPVELQVVVHTRLGSVTLHWPVTVSK